MQDVNVIKERKKEKKKKKKKERKKKRKNFTTNAKYRIPVRKITFANLNGSKLIIMKFKLNNKSLSNGNKINNFVCV